jgi:N-hydroxyarylamine O-acetyltransferase
MNIDDYLRRIGLRERPAPTLDGLRRVQRAHLLSIPYENFDVQFGRRLTTDVAAAYEKIVGRGRGGWCYEMNGLLGWALGELGFAVTRATGAVMREVRGEAVTGNHLVLRVDLPEGVYLADAGFGDGPLDPFAVRVGAIVSHGFPYSLARVADDAQWWRLANHPKGGAASFDFNLAPADEAQFSRMCEFLQTWEQSGFVLNAVAQRYVEGGIMILRGRSLRFLRPDGFEDREIVDAGDLVETLRRDFALDLPEAAELWPKIAARHEVVMAERAAAAAL